MTYKADNPMFVVRRWLFRGLARALRRATRFHFVASRLPRVVGFLEKVLAILRQTVPKKSSLEQLAFFNWERKLNDAQETVSLIFPEGTSWTRNPSRTTVLVAFEGRNEVLREIVSTLLENTQEEEVGFFLLGGPADHRLIEELHETFQERVVGATVELVGQTLGFKWQLGAELVRQHWRPREFLVIQGSDDYVSPRYFRDLVSYSSTIENLGLVAFSSFHTMKVSGNLTFPVMATWKVLPSGPAHSVGAGRGYRLDFLDFVDWRIFDVVRNRGLDDRGALLVQNSRWSELILKSDSQTFVCLVKGSWDMLNPLEAIARSPGLAKSSSGQLAIGALAADSKSLKALALRVGEGASEMREGAGHLNLDGHSS